jgi:hypothetical protein
LLSTVENLHEYRALLIGGEIRVHTDHKNLTYKHLRSERVLHWCLLIEEYAPTFIYKPGAINIGGDFLSRHPILEEAAIKKQCCFEPLLNDWQDEDEMLLDSYLNYPVDGGNFPLNLPDIEAAQQQHEAI